MDKESELPESESQEIEPNESIEVSRATSKNPGNQNPNRNDSQFLTPIDADEIRFIDSGSNGPTKTVGQVNGSFNVQPTQPPIGDGIDSRSLPFKLIGWVSNSFRWLFGLFGLILSLAFAATMPIFQYMALGYFFEVSGRINRRGKFREGFVGIEKAERLASIIVGTWLLLWPITLLATWWEASYLIDPASQTTLFLRRLQVIGTIAILGHIFAAWFCGGKLRYFFWPIVAPFAFGIWITRRAIDSRYFRPILDKTVARISPKFVDDICRVQPMSDWFLPAIMWKSLRSGELYTRARDGVWDFTVGLRLPYLFWLGLRGFIGTMVWLLIPVSIMIASSQAVDAAAVITGFFGVVLFSLVATYLPILQAHFATENRLGAMFEIRVARETFRRAPVRHLIMLLATFVFALPLYLLKIEQILPELLFLPGMVFIAFMLPTRLLSGWAYLAATKKEKRASLFFRWPAWAIQIPLAIAFAGFVFVMRFVIWSGAAGLFDQHTFLVPAPFVEWPF